MLEVGLTVLGALGALGWVYLLLAHGRFWLIDRLAVGPSASDGRPWRVAVIIPARNEAEVVGHSLSSLLQQAGSAKLAIFLVDDGSSDGTAEAAVATARRAPAGAAVTIIRGRPLPPGWLGKLWALQQGTERAREFEPDFFLLTDADIVHGPETISTLLAIAERGRYDLVSFMVRLRCATFAEKLLIPAFVFFFFKLYPPAWIADRRRMTAGAAGGCILVRPAALARAGGMEAIRHEIIDDCALARAVKHSGGDVWLGLTEVSHSIRAYRSFREVGRMVARNAFNQLHHSTLLLAAAGAGLVVLYLAPVGLLFAGLRLPAALAAFAWALMAVAYLPLVRFYRLNPLWALTLPAAAVFYMGATVMSALNYWAGRGGQWKGRAQDVAASKPR